MSNLEYDHPVIVRGFIIKTYDGAPSTGHDSFLLNSYALHLNYLKYHRILSNKIRRGSVQAYNTLFQSPQWVEIVSEYNNLKKDQKGCKISQLEKPESNLDIS